MKKITVIPATINPLTKLNNSSNAKRRVAGYARVSTDSDDQFSSYEAQVDYYTNYIKSKPEWEFVDVYTDEGISGTSTKRREGFRSMISDALKGKIDLIVTKSVSRFARNTVDSLVTIRNLKEAGVECYFEKENIYTFDGKGELLITIMISLAQEESRSMSENITWGHRKSFADGKVRIPYKNFLGYKKGEDGKPEIVEEEAKVIRLIYRLFLEGATASGIAKELTRRKIKTPHRKNKWYKTTVDSILTNEKYKGDALLQKKFTVDFLQGKMKVNEGEVPQYYVENSHPAIIDKTEWDMVQAEFIRRQQLGRSYSSKDIFSSKLVCADCGGFYGQKVWHSNSKYRKVIWQCNDKFKDKENRCSTLTLEVSQIKDSFLKAYNEFMENRDTIIKDTRLMQKALKDTSSLDDRITNITKEITEVTMLVQTLVNVNANHPQAQDEYRKRYDELSTRFDGLNKELDNLIKEKDLIIAKDKRLDTFIENLKTQDLIISEWDDSLWNINIERGVVDNKGKITFQFFTGQEIKQEV